MSEAHCAITASPEFADRSEARFLDREDSP
jgi:hypothetical protein